MNLNDVLLVTACVAIFIVLIVGATYNISMYIIRNKKNKKYDIIATYIISNMNDLLKDLINNLNYSGLDNIDPDEKEVYEYIKNAITLQILTELTKRNVNTGTLNINDISQIIQRVFIMKKYTPKKLYKHYKKISESVVISDTSVRDQKPTDILDINDAGNDNIGDILQGSTPYNNDIEGTIESEDALDEEVVDTKSLMSSAIFDGFCKVDCYEDKNNNKSVYISVFENCTNIVEIDVPYKKIEE